VPTKKTLKSEQGALGLPAGYCRAGSAQTRVLLAWGLRTDYLEIVQDSSGRRPCPGFWRFSSLCDAGRRRGFRRLRIVRGPSEKKKKQSDRCANSSRSAWHRGLSGHPVSGTGRLEGARKILEGAGAANVTNESCRGPQMGLDEKPFGRGRIFVGRGTSASPFPRCTTGKRIDLHGLAKVRAGASRNSYTISTHPSLRCSK